MFKNYFKVALRNLWRSKAFSAINISGLAIGMASAMLILLWIQSETSYDQFHPKKDRIYEAWNRAHFSGKLNSWSTTPKVLASALSRDIPEVEQAVRVNWSNRFLFSLGEKRLAVQGNMVDSNFFEVFGFPLIKGNPKQALMDMHNVVLTEKLAESLFGKEDPMGKMVKIDNKDNFTVSGIVKDPPTSSRFNFQYLVPWSYLRSQGGDDENWGNNSTKTYVLLKENASFASANEKIRKIKVRYDSTEDKRWEMFLYPMSKWRLYSKFTGGYEDGGRIVFVRMFGIIAAFILLIACINFMNLSTARSEKRAREVGIRKVVGAQKGALVAQFIGESILLALLAGIIAVFIVWISLPGFNQLTDKKLTLDFSNGTNWLWALAFVVVTGIVAGSYPAFYLSSFQPVRVLKGLFRSSKALVTPRKLLVIVQFTFAITLIIGTIIVKRQINYAQDRETGYNKNNLIYHFLTGDLEKNYDLVKHELISGGIATSVSKTSAPLTEGWSDTWGLEWTGKAADDKTDFDIFNADADLVKTAGFQLVQGRDFDLKKYPTDSNGMILNESAVKAMNFKEPLGQIVKNNGEDWHVIGVIKDFILQSPYLPMKPMAIQGGKGWFNAMHIKLNVARSTEDNLQRAGAIFKKYNPEYPFEYKFIDDEYARKFQDERRTGTLTALFAGLTIFISCLGLFGLAAYMAQNRKKEIGIRKVLGASVTNITTLLSRDFLVLVAIALVLASLIAGFVMHKWLQDYPYRVSMGWTVFLISGLAAIGIALLTVSFQAIRAATSNPVNNLRNE